MEEVILYTNADVPHEITLAAGKYIKMLPQGETFLTYICYPRAYLNHLPGSVIKYCQDDEFPQIFTQVANNPHPRREDRIIYLSELLHAYRRMESSLAIASDTILIGPQREGALLVRELGWDKKAKRTLFPHAKRIPYQKSLVVGLGDIQLEVGGTKAVIVDGAIASGATLMAIMSLLRAKGTKEIEIYSVHGTEKGLFNLDQFAQENDIQLAIHIAFVSGILNEKYYAVYPYDPSTLVIGDLGDTITVLFDSIST